MRRQILMIFAFLSVNWAVNAQIKTSEMERFILVVHGGAGTILKKNMTDEKEKAYKDKLEEAMKIGHEILKKGGTSVDAVEATIEVLEDSPLFNAGKGAVFTSDGKNEMDASIMDGKTLNAGAVAEIRTVKNPISLARKVMESSPHVMMTGKGAAKFARDNDIEMVDTSYFYDEMRWKQWNKIKDTKEQKMDHSEDRGEISPPSPPKGKGEPIHLNSSPGPKEEGSQQPFFDIEFNPKIDSKYGTVGAVALDKYGNIAAGTSTGGMTNKMYGRVGDSPIIGAGTYANNNTCAVSCTGHGEYFIRSVVAYDISALMEYKNMTVKEAADEVIHKKLPELGGSGGVIAVDAKGNFTMPFNTEGMYRGVVKENGKIEVFIYKE
ncbi:MAG: beta-aspartyl-peptidase [Bacteroidetes bacterium]|nr:MAG: beta-aspartyl-peptidase [Bacteroidota bacterium]